MTAQIKLINATVGRDGNVRIALRARCGTITSTMRAAWSTHPDVLAVTRGNKANTAELLVNGHYQSAKACASRDALVARLDYLTAA